MTLLLVLLLAGTSDVEWLLQQRQAGVLRPVPGLRPEEWRKSQELRAQNRGWRGRKAGGRRLVVDSVVRSDFVVNDDTTGGTSQQSPAVKVRGDGTSVLFWHEFRDGDADVWFGRFAASGAALGPNLRANDDVTLGWQGSPAVAVLADGGFIATWEDRREIGNSDLFGQRFGPDGSPIGANFRVSDSGVAGDQDFSGVHAAPNRTVLVAWDDRRFGLTGDIFAQFFNPDGTKRDTNFRVNDDAIGQANQYEPAVTGDDSGRFVVAWMDGRGRNPYDWNIFCQRFSNDGSRLGGNIQVTTNDSIQWSPDVACAPGGEFLVVWEDRRAGGQYDIYARLYNRSGQPVGPDFRVNDDAGSADQVEPAVAANSFGEFLVVWTDSRNGPADVYARRYDSNGAALGSSFRVNDDAGTAVQQSPTVAACPGGGYEVVWLDDRLGDFDLFGIRLDRAGIATGPSCRRNDDWASSHQRVSSIGATAAGNFCVVWEDERNGGTDIYRAVFDTSGSELGPNQRLNSDPAGGAAQYYAAVAGGSNRFVAAWTDFRTGPQTSNIYARLLDGAGNPLGPEFVVNSSGTAFVWYPYCAMDLANNAAIVWMDMRNGPFNIYCRRYDSLGNPFGPEFAVSDTTAEADYASVAMNRSGRFVVSWMDNRNSSVSGFDIYCQLFRPDGSRVGPNIRVNTDVGRAYQGYPSCAIAADGRVAVAWEDGRDNRYEIYLQWFDSTGQRLGDNERVSDGIAGNDCYSPSLAFADDGTLFVGFNDERDVAGNSQYYCQRFRPDRTRIGNNQRINEPNRFPKEQHWSIGQSVVVLGDRVAFAWTGNPRHRGWDIVAKVTDQNLVGVSEPAASVPVFGAGTVFLAIGRRLVLPDSRYELFSSTGRRLEPAGPRPAKAVNEVRIPSAGVYFLVSNGSCQKVVVP